MSRYHQIDVLSGCRKHMSRLSDSGGGKGGGGGGGKGGEGGERGGGGAGLDLSPGL